MDMKSNISSYDEWQRYRKDLFQGFRKSVTRKEHYKYKDIRLLFDKIDWCYSRISIEEVKMRQDRKPSHLLVITKYQEEIHTLIDVLNENFVMEILLGD